MPAKMKLKDRSKYVQAAKPIGDITMKEFKQTEGLAKKHAERKGKPEVAGEFAGHLMEFLVKQGTFYYNIHWVWEQFCRQEYGKLKHSKDPVTGKVRINKKGTARATGRTHGRVSLTKLVKASDDGKGEAEHALTDPKPLPDRENPVKLVADKLDGNKRICFVLHYKWDFTLEEIAEVIGVSRERVRQILLLADSKTVWMQKTNRIDLTA